MTDAKHTSKIVGDFVLGLFSAVHFVDKLIKGLIDGVHVDLMFLVHFLGNFIGHFSKYFRIRSNHVLLNACYRSVLPDLQIDKLVWDDTHLLEGQSLDASSRESLNDPTLSFLFKSLDLLLHDFDHDLVVNCLNDRALQILKSDLPNWKFSKHCLMRLACGPED